MLVALDVLEPHVNRAEVGRVLALVIENLEGRSEITWRMIITELTTNLRAFPFRIPTRRNYVDATPSRRVVLAGLLTGLVLVAGCTSLLSDDESQVLIENELKHSSGNAPTILPSPSCTATGPLSGR
ncbi:hypothetical protein C9J85_19465 [Haloferax sp. wsp5]|nr:hypothetical protein C9J85_19465 [Haloferax sp. wsp5]